MREPHLQQHPIKVRQLIEDYRAGRIVIPESQREYVWTKSKAPRLIDSLYRESPISSLLPWASTEEPRARRRDPRPTRSGMISWLMDGQQRVEDRLGFARICVHAHQSGEPVVRDRVTELDEARRAVGRDRGLPISDSSLTPDAVDRAAEVGTIRLIDGTRLTHLMFEYNVRVTVAGSYMVKEVDAACFSASRI